MIRATRPPGNQDSGSGHPLLYNVRMTQVTLPKTEGQFDELVERARAGEEIVITVHGKPAARLLPVESEQQPRPALRPFGLDKGMPLQHGRKPVFGMDEGKFTLPDDFDIMSEEELAEWYDAPLDE